MIYLIYGLIFGIPALAVIFFIVSLVKYLREKDKEARKSRLPMLIISAVAMGVTVGALIALVVTACLAIAYM